MLNSFGLAKMKEKLYFFVVTRSLRQHLMQLDH